MKYLVKREHHADGETFVAGDFREAEPRQVGHLVARGILVEPAEIEPDPASDPTPEPSDPAPEPSDQTDPDGDHAVDEKAAKPVRNKAVKAPQNKAAG